MIRVVHKRRDNSTSRRTRRPTNVNHFSDAVHSWGYLILTRRYVLCCIHNVCTCAALFHMCIASRTSRRFFAEMASCPVVHRSSLFSSCNVEAPDLLHGFSHQHVYTHVLCCVVLCCVALHACVVLCCVVLSCFVLCFI